MKFPDTVTLGHAAVHAAPWPVKLHPVLSASEDTWRSITGSDRHIVSDRGMVFDLKNGCFLALSGNSRGYQSVWISGLNKTGEVRLVHRLVCEAFHGPPPNEKSQVNHKNGIKSDNSAANLEWVSCAENMKHGHDNGLYPNGERHYKSVIKKTDIPDIWSMRQAGATFKQIGDVFGVGANCIHKILTHKNRKRETINDNGPIWGADTGKQAIHSIICTEEEHLAVCEFLAERRIGGAKAARKRPPVSGHKAK